LSHNLLILGASTRAAAFSAHLAGFQPRCADYFADRDLAELCPVDRVDPDHAADQFVELARSIAPSPWFYTGGFENHPDCVERISRRHALWGVDANALRAVRDPHQVADVLARCGIPCPDVRSDPRHLPRDGTWLKKPMASGGGRGIEALSGQDDRGSATHYFQERIDGPSFSALYIGDRSAAHAPARLIGASRQLTGVPGSPFGYLGSIGPMPATEPLWSRLKALGNALASAFGLAGWFGIDFILRDGIPWPVEVNPRYTASVEIFELASCRSLLPDHLRACAPTTPPAQISATADIPAGRVIAKWILYAPRLLVAPEIVPEQNRTHGPVSVRSIADVPWRGTCFNVGEPVMTLMTTGADLADCWSRMILLEQTWSERLGIAGDEQILGRFSSPLWC
jgi:uncharacterized protein